MADSAFIGLLALAFICIVYIAGDPGRYLSNIIIMNLVFLMAVIAYFTTLTAGLVLNLVFIFAYGAFIVYRTVTFNEPLDPYSYFWLAMAPLLTAVSAALTAAQRRLQAENEELRQRGANQAVFDENTDLRNSVSFRKDAIIFAGISVRYKIPLTLLVIKVKYWNEIRRLIPPDRLSEAMYDLSQLSQSSIRTNDALYLLEPEEATWGLLLFTDGEGSKIVVERIKEKLKEMNEGSLSAKYKVSLGLKMGAAEYDAANAPDPFEWIAEAKKQLEYDV